MADGAPEFGSAEWITAILPHRYPMLLVDRVVEIEPGKRLLAIKNVSQNEPFFQGHFPGRPVMPGVLIIEAMAQSAAILLLHDDDDRGGKLPFFSTIDKAKFRRPVRPGDCLMIEVVVERTRSTYARVKGTARVNDTLAVEAICSCVMVSRSDLDTG